MVFVLMFQTVVFAQIPPSGASRGAGNSQVHLFGKVLDAQGETVPFANVLLMQRARDSSGTTKTLLYKGTLTENNGEFSFEELTWKPNLLLRISAIGFTDFEQELTIQPQAEIDLGKLTMPESAQDLDEVTVTAMEYSMRLDIDKKVFNVGQNSVSEGGTAVDVMRNVPSVNVDIDGNVTMRNSSPQIFLDGRPTTLTLDQIPADAIESVEIMTNPSSKYDASGGGGGGILNVVLKKNKKTGYNGNVRAGVDSYGSANFGSNFNVRQNKINFNIGLNGRLDNRRTYGSVDRTNYEDGIAAAILNQENQDRNNGGMVFARFGLDYLVTNKLTLSLSGVKMLGSRGSVSTQDYTTDSLFNTYTTTTYSSRNSESDRSMNNTGLVFGLKQLLKREGEEWTLDANYFSGTNDFLSNYSTTNAQGSSTDLIRQKIEGGGTNRNLILQTDYVIPFKTVKLEAGLRAALRSRSTINNNFYYRDSVQDYVQVYAPTSNFDYSDQVYAAYTSVSGKVGKFGYKAGLRAESSRYQGKLTLVDEQFSNAFPLSLFPTLFLSRELKGNQDIQLSYTRRVNRPDFRELIPFTDSTDKFNISRGNASLVPEFTQALELSYMKQFKKGHTLMFSTYYRYSNNLITRYIYEDENGQLINSYINANSSYNGGFEITAQNSLFKWWELTSNVNIYNSRVNVSDEVNAAGTQALWSGFAKINSNFRFKNDFSLQLSGMYQSRTNSASGSGGRDSGGPPNMQAQSSSQGYIDDYFSIDIALKKSFLKNKLAVTLSMSDIFRTRYNTIYSHSDYFDQVYRRISNPQQLRLNVSYNFGKVDAVLFRRKSDGTGESIPE